MSQPYGETVVLRHRDIDTESIDALGVLVPIYTEITYDRIPIWQVDANGIAGNEITGGRDTIIYGLSALLPKECPIAAYDQLVARGIVYEVDGNPSYLHSFFTGWEPGILCTLRRVEG